MDDDNVVTIDLVGTVPELRCQGLGDLVMRMLLYRVLEMELPMVKLDAPAELVPFFARYGLKPTDEQSGGLVRIGRAQCRNQHRRHLQALFPARGQRRVPARPHSRARFFI